VARLRLFGPAREAAGTATCELPGTTVAEVLAGATARFGEDFARVLDRAKVWVNGTEFPPEHPVGPDDEVAVLPPVSGG
jgi:sulfur-carrier protein